MATKTAMHQDIRSLFQTGSEATATRRRAIRCSLPCCRVEPQRRRRAWRCAMATLYNTAKVLEQQLITRF